MKKLYIADVETAPNPRRVLIFLNEKQLLSPSSPISNLKLIPLDLFKSEHKRPEYLKKNIFGRLPFLELEDGKSYLAESISICRYLEEETASSSLFLLFGTSPFQKGLVDMWIRRIDLELNPIRIAWTHHPRVLQHFKKKVTSETERIQREAIESALKVLELFDQELKRNGDTFLISNYFSMADIVLFCTLSFAEMNLGMKWNQFSSLQQWYQRISQRPSIEHSKFSHLQAHL